MLDLRPVGYVIGLMVMTLGLAMVMPMLVDIAEDREHWPAFAQSAILTVLIGGLVALACRNGVGKGQDVLQSVMTLLTIYVLSFGLFAVGLELVGLTFTEALTGAWTSLFNIGPAFGPSVASTGAIDAFPAAAKWLMIIAMLMGRLEVVAVVVLLVPAFWRI